MDSARLDTLPVPEVRELRWAFAGGGTGGHIVPGLHLLDELGSREPVPARLVDLVWFTSGRAVEERVLSRLEEGPARGVCQRVRLPLEPSGGGAPSLARLARRLGPAVLAARRGLREHHSELLLGLGGFTAAPAVLAARSLGLPAFLLEVNAAAGRATRVLAPVCRRVFHVFPASLPRRASARHVVVGPIVAPRFHAARRDAAARTALRRAHGFDEAVPLLCALGGSQGAAGVNRFLREHGRALTAAGVAVLHQVGPGRLAEAAPQGPLYRALEYVDDVAAALAGADFVLCRGGASTLVEVAAVGTPAWVVPYPHHADRHQERNARAIGGGLEIVPESTLDGAAAERLGRLVALHASSREAQVLAAHELGDRGGARGARRLLEELLTRA